MGMNASIYLGVFLQVKETPTTQKVESYTHPDTGKDMKSRFDPDDGKEGILKIDRIQNTSRPSPYIDVDWADEDDFYCPEYSGAPEGWENFIPNGGDFSIRTPDIESDGTVDFDSEFQIEQKILDFREEYKDYIDYWNEHYDDVVIKFGLIIYWS